jgi:hypothetical protein
MIVAASFAGFSASAQEGRPQAASETEITVTGNRDVESQVREFVAALTPGAVDGNVARFETSICPRVVGASPEQNRKMEERLRAIAVGAGLLLGPERCGANALMIITQDKRALMRGLASRGNYFGDRVTPFERRRLAQQPGPTAFWRLEGFLTAQGTVLASNDGEPAEYLQSNSRASRISTGTRRAVDGAILVVEARALDGLTTTQVADYAAMRLYGFADPASLPKSANTVLTILDAEMGAEIPITLTPWDLSFLRALYASNVTVRSSAQRSEISRRLLLEMSRSSETAQ